MTAALTLSDLVARQLSLRWYEGIAIVRGVAARLLEHQGTATCIPELHQIELRADGAVMLAAGVPANEPVRRLGQLVQVLLTDADVPVQLRLLVSQATAPIPCYSSLAEFDQALAYFERPDRTGLLKSLFARAEAAGPMTGGGDVPQTLDRLAPLDEATANGQLTYWRRKNVRGPIATVAALAAVLVLSSVVALYAKRVGPTVKGRVVSRTVAAADAVAATLLAGVSAVSERVGLGRIVAANAADAPPGSPAPLPPADRPHSQAAPSIAAHVDLVNAGIEDVPPRAVIAYEVPEVRTTEALGQSGDAPAHLDEAPIDSVVYATGAHGVSPPIDIRPHLRRQLPPSVDPANLSRIELTISPDGSVESARLLGNRRDLQGGMFLSATKAWRFRPATKDGMAVRYRMTILVSFE
jgi:hypothetical protein